MAVERKGTRSAPIGKTNDKGFFPILLKISGLFEELRKDTDGLQNYEKMCINQTTLKLELEKKNEEIEVKNREMTNLREQKDENIANLQEEVERLKSDEDCLMQKFGAKFKIWDADSNRHSSDIEVISRLKSELESSRGKAEVASRENDRLRDDRRKLRNEVEDYRKCNDTLENTRQLQELKLKDTRTRLENCRSRVKKLTEEVGILLIDQEQMSELALPINSEAIVRD